MDNTDEVIGDTGVQESSDESDSDNDGNSLEATIAPGNHTFRWRKSDLPRAANDFDNEFSLPPEPSMSPLDYFTMFCNDDLLNLVVENTNLYSVQTTLKSIDTNIDEIRTFIGMHILMGIIKLPSYRNYWSGSLRYPSIADAMSRNRFESLRRFLHFVDNNSDHDATDKLFKIKPVLASVRNQCVMIEPEEFHSVDEQIIPSKTKYTKIRQYNPKKPRKWGFKNLVRAGSSGFMYDFYIYGGKEPTEENEYSQLQKSAQVVARLCLDLPRQMGHKVFFDNWFTTLDLMLYLKEKGLLAVGTIRGNRVKGCPLLSNKDIEKCDRGELDYRVDTNSGIIIIKWMDNSAVQLASNFVGVEPMDRIERWDKKEQSRVNIPCPQIIKAYNKSMGGVDLADMLIALYRIEVKTKRWYLKVFWHCIDIAKVNAWILYRRHLEQQRLGTKPKPLLAFSLEIADALMHANKTGQTPIRGRPSKRKLSDARPVGRKPVIPLPCNDVRYDGLGHWPIPTSDKKRCRLCQQYCRVYCEKCSIYLCLLQDRNCFKNFHNK